MDENILQPGDLVQLKSGGPVMTVTNDDPLNKRNGSVQCKWFSGNKLERGSFPIAALQSPPTKDTTAEKVR